MIKNYILKRFQPLFIPSCSTRIRNEKNRDRKMRMDTCTIMHLSLNPFSHRIPLFSIFYYSKWKFAHLDEFSKRKIYIGKTWKTKQHEKFKQNKKARKISLLFIFLYPAVDDELERFESCRTGIRDGRLPLHFHNRIVLNGIFEGRKRIESFDYYVNSTFKASFGEFIKRI